MSNLKKSQQLGMPFGTASNRLRKRIIFDLIQRCGVDTCYQCGKVIDTMDDMSIEHIVPWLDSENPLNLFFDIDNIAFSHLKCNCAASRTNGPPSTHPSLWSYKQGCRCEGCTKYNREAVYQYRNKCKGTPNGERGDLESPV